MTSRYRVEYALKQHKRDELIEWVKGLLAVPFVLHGETDEHEQYAVGGGPPDERRMEQHERRIEKTLQARYCEVFRDVEKLVDNTIALDAQQPAGHGVARTRLRQLVPSVGRFFTRLPLPAAFLAEDRKRSISRRAFVSPSFNDVRSVLNTAQVLALAGAAGAAERLRLVTFDGDVTLYADGQNLEPGSPLVALLVKLLSLDVYVAVVTAAGYPGPQGAQAYQERLRGLVAALRGASSLSPRQKNNFLVMGGESNYLFRFDCGAGEGGGSLRFVEGTEWYLPAMQSWSPHKIGAIMDLAHEHLRHLRKKLRLDCEQRTAIVRKERSLGIVPVHGYRIQREALEELVLSVSHELNAFAQTEVKVCAFNGGADVWVDIGDKALGVEALQHYLHKTCGGAHGPILKSSSLHIGDQFASVGANDFKARLSACTVWIASPRETREILEDLTRLIAEKRGVADGSVE